MFDETLMLPFTTFLAEFLFTLMTLMSGSLVVIVRGWGKLRFQNQFASFWKLVGYVFAEAVIFAYTPDFFVPLISSWLRTYINYAIGLSSGIVGLFFLWIVYAGDFDIRTEHKWFFPVVCFAITVVNFHGNQCVGFPSAC